ncbi:exosporium protein C [Paenibacillus guangzhouensis]|uniref:exosporium protein C n=1 Tax=Paenibacillus guangzhouensis TaxID=1473112 RepID=UPI0012668F78|nr:exosporium protein C [Paenibacillus guangzhouensis]
MAQILAYNASEPARVTDSVAIPVPLTPVGIGIAEFNLVIPSVPNFVELKAMVGIRGDVNIGSLLFRIFRDGQVIFYAQEGFESAGSEQFYLVPIQTVDPNVTPGAHAYTLSVENLTADSAATVIGPIVFSGLAVSA